MRPLVSLVFIMFAIPNIPLHFGEMTIYSCLQVVPTSGFNNQCIATTIRPLFLVHGHIPEHGALENVWGKRFFLQGNFIADTSESVIC